MEVIKEDTVSTIKSVAETVFGRNTAETQSLKLEEIPEEERTLRRIQSIMRDPAKVSTSRRKS